MATFLHINGTSGSFFSILLIVIIATGMVSASSIGEPGAMGEPGVGFFNPPSLTNSLIPAMDTNIQLGSQLSIFRGLRFIYSCVNSTDYTWNQCRFMFDDCNIQYENHQWSVSSQMDYTKAFTCAVNTNLIKSIEN